MWATDELMGDLFAIPYTLLEPDLAFVIDEGGRAVGYVVGTADTPAFAAAYREQYIPRMLDRYPVPDSAPETPDEHMIAMHHNPERLLIPALVDYPAHLHIDLLPDQQRKGYGRLLMTTMLSALADRGAPAVHLGMVTTNRPARLFYDRLGFHEIDVREAGVLTYLGRSTTIE